MGISASEYNAWYARLNAVRSRHGLAQLSKGVSVGNSSISAHMTAVRTDLSDTSKQSNWIPDVDYDIDNVNTGARILLSSKTKIESVLTSMEAVCVHNGSNYSSDYSSDDYTYNGWNDAFN